MLSAQTFNNPNEGEKLNGKVKSVTYQRVYFIWKGKQINGVTKVLWTSTFNLDGRLIQTSTFGNGEEKLTFTWAGDTFSTRVEYFDQTGKPAPKLSESFVSPTDDFGETGLCPEFQTQTETDTFTKIRRDKEICSDGSWRRTITSEKSSDNHILRESSEDNKGRTTEWINDFGVNFALKGSKGIINDRKSSIRTWDVTYTVPERDSKGNEIRKMTTSVSSRFAGILYQYFEDTKITYFDD